MRRLNGLRLSDLTRPRILVTTFLLLFVLLVLPQLMSLYYVDTMTQVAVYSMVALDATTLTFLVISSLAAVLIARLRSIALTFAAALVVGLLHDLLTPIASLTSYRDMTPFVIAAIGLLVLSRHQVMTQSREEA